MFLVLTINILLMAFSITGTLVMTIIERRREIAILMAICIPTLNSTGISEPRALHRHCRKPHRYDNWSGSRTRTFKLGLALEHRGLLHRRHTGGYPNRKRIGNYRCSHIGQHVIHHLSSAVRRPS